MEKATKVLINGVIYTIDEAFTAAEAMAILGDRILCVGSNTDMDAMIGPDTEIVDLNGACVTPGFIDNHVHSIETGYTYCLFSCEGLTKEEIIAKVAEEAAVKKPGEWIVSGTGWDNDWWEDNRYPNIDELDSISPNNPVLLRRKAGGVQWVNSLALKAAGFSGKDDPRVIEASIVNPDGKKAIGSVTKIGNIIRTVVPQTGVTNKHDPNAYDPERMKSNEQSLLAVQKNFFKMGLTSFTDARMVGSEIELTERLFREGKLKIRMYVAISGAVGSDPDVNSKRYFDENCPFMGKYNDRFSCRMVKLGAGGTFGSRSASMFEEYSDNPGNYGQPRVSEDEFYLEMKQAIEKGMQIMIHAIGDKDTDTVLKLYERLDREYGIKDKRLKIEHWQLVRDDQPERAKALNVIPSLQPLHGPNSYYMAKKCLGPYRADLSYCIGEIQRRVGIMAGGSDSPVANPNPLSEIHAAITRKNDFLQPPEGAWPQYSAMDRESALRSFTIWGAYAQFGDDRYGSLEAGKYADYVIMDQDIMKIPADDILKIQILETVLGGETVYKKA